MFIISCLLTPDSGMVFQKLHLILCDREEERQVLEGVRYELQDCIFQNVASKTYLFFSYKLIACADPEGGTGGPDPPPP